MCLLTKLPLPTGILEVSEEDLDKVLNNKCIYTKTITIDYSFSISVCDRDLELII